jgi:putative phosphoesterase
MRVGVVTDTHVGEYLETLPPALTSALAGCDHIIHGGDISRAWVLDQLRSIAPVTAVQGDHDTFGDIDLPRSAVVTLGGVRIGVTHGRRWYPLEVVLTLVTVLSNGHLRWTARNDRALLRRTGPVDILIFGHWHVPVTRRAGRTVIFCPGAVCPWGRMQDGRAPRSGFGGLVDRTVHRFRTLQGDDAMAPAIGMIAIVDGQATLTRVMLD